MNSQITHHLKRNFHKVLHPFFWGQGKPSELTLSVLHATTISNFLNEHFPYPNK